MFTSSYAGVSFKLTLSSLSLSSSLSRSAFLFNNFMVTEMKMIVDSSQSSRADEPIVDVMMMSVKFVLTLLEIEP